MKKRFRRNSIAAVGFSLLMATAVAGVAPAQAGDIPESDDPVILAMNDWSSQNLITTIAGKLLTKMGYNVEYVTAGYIPQLTAIGFGDLTATLEMWEVSAGEGYTKGIEEGKLEILGLTGMQGAAGWVYPAFVEELCPGLPDIRALQDCAEVFATPDTYPQGRVIDQPADWGDFKTVERVAAYEIDFQVVKGGSEGAMMAEVKAAFQSQTPLLIYLWWPHWVFAEYDLHHLDEPAYEDACWEDPSWGPNPDLAYDCTEAALPITKVAWPGMKDKWPGAYRFLKAFQISTEDDVAMMHAYELGGESLDDLTDQWIADNEAIWSVWIDEAAQ